jgi:hypothetical protein
MERDLLSVVLGREHVGVPKIHEPASGKSEQVVRDTLLMFRSTDLTVERSFRRPSPPS